jgi:multimeric flavodoxin WrbA
MKVLAIISSPRKKNTFESVKRIEEVHKSVAPCEYEYLFLKDINLVNCTGCHVCLTKGEQFCPLKDDRDLIISKIEASDAVILASPNHTMNVNWRMKNFIDRFSYLLHRPRYFGQRFLVLVTSGSYRGVKQAMNALAPMASGGKVIGRIGVMYSPGMNEAKRDGQAKKLHREALRFARRMARPFVFRPSLSYLMWFSAFKALAGLHPKEAPADFEYYKNKSFFVDTRLAAHQKLVLVASTALFGVLIKLGMI